MLDIKRIRQNPQELRDALHARNQFAEIDTLLEQDDLRRKLMIKVEEKKANRNSASKALGTARKEGISGEALAVVMDELREVSDEISMLDAQVAELDAAMDAFLLKLPNYPHASVPVGASRKDSVEIRRWGTPRFFPWEPKTHRDIGADLAMVEWDSSANKSSVQSPIYRGAGARFKRAVINLFMNTHWESGYEEIDRSFVSPSETTGARSSFLAKEPQSASPLLQAVQPLSTICQNRIFDISGFPLRYCTYQQTCDTVELSEIVQAEHSYHELEYLTSSAEKVLQLLGLPYRIVLLSTGSMDFSSAKTYAIEVWLPSENRYVEVCVCSNQEDFQSRSAGIRCRCMPKDKPQYVHTLSSSTAIEGIIAAIWENYQNEDGSIAVPEMLVSSMQTTQITQRR